MDMQETNSAEPTVYPTTYGSLSPGERYRLPGQPRWYRRSESAFVTDAMRARPVEALEPHLGGGGEEAARAS
ncbi:hypothetical protein EPN52_14025 [bacterium]|nr:MAG: hypothetical protein EPN52_14025 [bacterium]